MIQVIPKPDQLCDISKLTTNNSYKHNNKPWRNHRREVVDNDDIQSIMKSGGKVYGMASTSKSTTFKQTKKDHLKTLTSQGHSPTRQHQVWGANIAQITWYGCIN
jgi:hypothetical protein